MFWDKEKVVSVWEEPDDVQHDPYIRKGKDSDKRACTKRIDRETGNWITLWEEKLKFPYKTKIPYVMTVVTTTRTLIFKLRLLDRDNVTGEKCFIWNGQNIPNCLWSLLGISKDSPIGLQASKWHDNLLCAKEDYLAELRKEYPTMTVGEYRRITTLIYRQWLKEMGVNTIKANIMAAAVAGWQFVSPQWWGME